MQQGIPPISQQPNAGITPRGLESSSQASIKKKKSANLTPDVRQHQTKQCAQTKAKASEGRPRVSGVPASPCRGPAPADAGTGPLCAKMPLVGQRRPALPRPSAAVPSALGGLTSGFGTGPGVPPLPWPLTNKGHSAVTGAPPCPQGRTALGRPTPREAALDRAIRREGEELGLLVALG